MNNTEAGWLTLIHQVPPTPAYLRAKVMRRLSQLGALPLKRSAYLLPASDAALEDFQWLRQEIVKAGGEAWIVAGDFVGGLRDEQIREKFRALRAPDYRSIADSARTLVTRLRGAKRGGEDSALELRRLRRRLDAARRVDFFQAAGRDEAEALMASIDKITAASREGEAKAPRSDDLKARTWVTRAGVKVDRMASAWLIRRFIDPAATFVFVRPGEVAPDAGVRFDMFEGEFTHDADRCTFEVLLSASGQSADSGLRAIAQIVHDIDLRDDRYQRPETAGVSAMIDGIASRFDDDHRRCAESASFFETLYVTLGRKRRRRTAAKR